MLSRRAFNITTFIIRSILIIIFLFAIIRGEWLAVLISFSTFVLTLVPPRLEDIYHIKLPMDFEIAIIFFLFATMILGEIVNFYERFWWWDILLHFSSAIAFGCTGFIILFYLNRTNKISSKPIWIALFSFSFAVSIGVMWEIFEFAMDYMFGMNMQKSGIVDTMWDLIVDVIGALLASLAGLAYMKGDQRSYISHMIAIFIKENPKIEL